MTGETLSRYRIAEELGRGGMGIVYRAEDTQLGRSVALKVLPPDLLRDPELKARFLHEARAAAALDHPNICGIYEIDEDGGQLFMALPYLDGESLDKRIGRGPRPIDEVVDLAIQMAAALEEAHSKEIVHRDVKSGNVMVQRRGSKLHCTLMDFGLAKLAQSTRLTRAGSQMGTAAYMSPEQVEGSAVDRRTDIWALGVVIHEMTAGTLPFPSDYEQAQFYAILNEDAEPLSSLRAGVPGELERIVAKCLAKEPGQRYQSCTDLIVDLAALRKENSASRAPTAPARASGLRTGARQAASPVTAAAVRARLVAALAIGAVAGSAAAWLSKPSGSAADWVPRYEISRLTWDSGLSRDASLSGDGNLVAYSSDRDGGGHLDIWVEHVGGGGRIQVTDAEEEDLWPVFSPDASVLAFMRIGTGHTSTLYLAPSLGGSPRILAEEAGPAAFSPDGNTVSYPGPDGQLMLVGTDGGEPRVLQSGFDSVHRSLWLPDGKHVLFSALAPQNQYDWWVTSVDGGEPSRTHLTAFQQATRGLSSLNVLPTWIEPGRWILYGAAHSLWRIPFSPEEWSYPGPPEALSFGPSNVTSVSASDDGTIAASVAETEDGIWSVPLTAAPDAPLDASWQVVTGAVSPSLSRSTGRLAYIGRTGATDVYVTDLAAGSTMAITSDVNHVRHPVISADGRQVAYLSRPSRFHGDRSIRVHSLDSGQSRLLCARCGRPEAFSSDGERLLVTDGDPKAVYSVRLADGERSEFIRFDGDLQVDFPRYSPDGSWVAFSVDNDAWTDSRVMVAPAGSGQPINRADCIEVTDGGHLDWMPRWAPDGKKLYFLSNRAGLGDVWSVDVGPGMRPLREPRPVRIFDTTRFSLAVLLPSEPESIGLEVGGDHIYVTLREETGRIHLLKPMDNENGASR